MLSPAENARRTNDRGKRDASDGSPSAPRELPEVTGIRMRHIFVAPAPQREVLRKGMVIRDERAIAYERSQGLVAEPGLSVDDPDPVVDGCCRRVVGARDVVEDPGS